MKIESKFAISYKLKFGFVFLIKKAFPGYWESKEYIKKNNLSDDFSNELKVINQKRTWYAVFFMFLFLIVTVIVDLVPSEDWAEEQRNFFFIIDSIFLCLLLIFMTAILVKRKFFKSLEVQNFISHALVTALILWSTAISSIETSQINYFATYIFTILAISFFFYLRSISHFIYLFLGFFLLKFHYSWNDTFVESQESGYYGIVVVLSIMTFIIARVLIVNRMNGFVAHRKLIFLNKTLDKKVNEKTWELQETNKELEYEIEIRKRYQESLTEAKKKAEESDKLKSTFLANMSHEIRTPMNGILGFSELLSRRSLGIEKTQKYLKLIHSNSKQLLVLIDDILDISKIEANQLKVYPEETEINPILKNVQEFFAEVKESMGKKSIDIQLDIPKGDEDRIVYADPVRLGQVLNNLTKNALKFTDEGSVVLGYDPGKNETLFFVQDSGIGIPESKIEFVFNRFNQIDNSSGKVQGGTGLGLTISKGLVELMGGEIWCESETNKGSVFYFTVPNTRAYLNKRYNIDAITHQGKKLLANTTVLVVDDNEASYKLVKEYLEQYDVNVLHAKSGKQAIEKCASKAEISVVIMDLLLNKKEGNQAIELIKKCREDLPIIAQTSNTKYLDNTEMWNDIILKPVKERDLILTLIRNLPSN